MEKQAMIRRHIVALSLAWAGASFLLGCEPRDSSTQALRQPPPQAALNCSPPDVCAMVANTGQGNCVVVSCSSGDQVVVDCGSVGGGATIPAFLSSLNTKDKVHSIVISHGDLDHYSFIPGELPLSATTNLRHVIIADDYKQWADGSIKAWLDALPSHGVSMETIGSSDYDKPNMPHSTIGCSGVPGSGFYVLTANQGTTPNDKSIVLKYQPDADPSHAIILPGDATKASEKAAIANYKKDGQQGFLASYALLVGHHGSGSDTHNTTEWVELIQPRAIIFSSAGSLSTRYHHPRCIAAGKFFTTDPPVVVESLAHVFGCWERKSGSTYDWNQSISTYNDHAVFGTEQSGLIVYRVNGTTPEVWSCPDNVINDKCKREVPK